MRPDDPDSAAVFDFQADLEEDRARGGARPLAEYLARYPGHEEAIAAEFVRQRVEAGVEVVAQDEDERRVGPYRLIEELGRGGQGSVWRAEDTRIQRTVALKLLTSLFATSERRARLRREAESIARLAHPGVCPVLEAEVEGEVPYIAMPLLEGRDLARELLATDPVLPWVPRDRPGLERVLRFFERAALALHAAHQAGLVHRDIKPANVIVSPEGDPVLLDFGLARDVDVEESDQLTRSGDVFGTPVYMSPEQLRGARTGLDRRTDVYSLGVTMIEALVGERPFVGATRCELERKILFEPPGDPRTGNPALPRDLAVVLTTAIDKDRERRYATAADLAEDLRRVRAHETVRARPLGPGPRLVRWAQRQPALAAALLSTMLALSVGLGFSLHWLGKERAANERFRGRQFAARSVELAASNPTASLALGIEAAELMSDHQGRSALFRPLFTCQLQRVLDAQDAARCWALEVSADRRAVGVFTQQVADSKQFFGRLVVWDLDRERPLADHRFDDPPLCLDLHPSGEVALLGTEGGEVVALELDGGRELFRERLGEKGDPLHWVEFAPDARSFVALTGGFVTRCAFPAGRLISSQALPVEGLAVARHSADGARLLLAPRAPSAVPGAARTAWLLDLVEREWVELGGHAGDVRWADWSADGARLVSAGADGSARLWDARGRPGRRIEAGAGLHAARFSPDGRRLALATDAGEVQVHDLEGGLPCARFPHQGAVVCLAWSPDGTRLASASHDLSTRVFALDPPREVAVGRGEMRPIDLVWDPNGEQVLTWTLGFRAYVWGAGPMPYAYRLGDERDVTRAGFGAGGAWTLSNGVVRRYGLEREGARHRTTGPAPTVDSGAAIARVGAGRVWWIDEHEGRVHTRTGDGPLQDGERVGAPRDLVLDPTGARALAWVGHPAVEALTMVDGAGRVLWTRAGEWGRGAFSPDGTRLAVADTRRLDPDMDDERIAPALLLDAATGEQVRELPRGALDLAWSPDGRTLALLFPGTRLESDSLLFLLDGEGRAAGRGHLFEHTRVTWSPQGDALVGWDQGMGARLALYRLSGDRLQKVVPQVRPRNGVESIAVHPSGRWFAAATRAGTTGDVRGEVLVWSTAGDAPLHAVFPLHEGTARVVAFGPDADDPRVLSAGEDGAFVWPLDPLPAARARQPRELDELERTREWFLATGERD